MNAQNKFCGWYDCDLTSRGEQEATDAARLLQIDTVSSLSSIDVIYTSRLLRAQKSAEIIRDELGLDSRVEIREDWRLNEQMYGALTGLNKKETILRFGFNQVHKWRRSWDRAPPPYPDKCWSGYFPSQGHPDSPKYKDCSVFDVPDTWRGGGGTESLEDTQIRAWQFWEERVVPDMAAGQRVLLVAHGNVMRALIKKLDSIAVDEIKHVTIPRCTPLLYRFDRDLKVCAESPS